MSGILVDIEEYAKNKGVTRSAVYKQMKTHKAKLEGHIENNAGKMWLDEEAVRILDDASNRSAPILVEAAEKRRVEEIENENAALKAQIEMLVSKNHEVLEKNIQLLEEKTILIEERNKAAALIEEHNNLKEKYEIILEEKGRLTNELEQRAKENVELSAELDEQSKEVERLKNRSLWQRIINK